MISLDTDGEGKMYVSDIHKSLKKSIDYDVILEYCRRINADGHLILKENTTSDGDCSYVCFSDTKIFMKTGGYRMKFNTTNILVAIGILVTIIFGILNIYFKI